MENVVFTDFGSHASLLTYKDGNKATGDVGQSCTRKKKPMVTAARAAAIFKEMLSSRREYCADSDFFRAVDVWEWMAEGTSGTKIKAYREVASSELQFKAGVVAFGDNVTLVVDGRLLELARKGSNQANFVLAHELGHLGLNHHARGAVVKNFQLFAQGSDMANVPPTTEELEANLAAIFFQCGLALLDDRRDDLSLAHRAITDVYTTKKARDIVRQDAFRSELSKLMQPKLRLLL